MIFRCGLWCGGAAIWLEPSCKRACADRALLICGTGVGTAIAANKVRGIRAATAHDLLTVRGSVENYDAQVLCMGQNVIAAPAAWALVDIWLDLRHDTSSSYAPKVGEIEAFERGA